MAESGKRSADSSAANTPELNIPDESKSAGLRVSTVFPHSSFTVEGIPVITAEGTMLTKAQHSKVEKVATEYGVTLAVEEVN